MFAVRPTTGVSSTDKNNKKPAGDSMRTIRKPWVALLCCSAVAVAACTSRSAGSGAVATPEAHTGTPPTGARQGAPSRVFLDPVSGQPREPTPAELTELERLERAARATAPASAKPDAPAEFRLPDGTVGMRFPDAAAQPLQACLQPDGSIDAHCHAATAPDRADPPVAEGRPGSPR
jgi:hypothetical protein